MSLARRLILAAVLALPLGTGSAALAQTAPVETPIVIGTSYALPSAVSG